ncbi:MAG: type III-B CRISPR module-associated protein Cmr5 [Ktedonobacteraceae bacterium]
MMQTRDQKYAAKVYDKVSKVSKEERDSYGSMAHKLPVLIRSAGLVQALAFVDARGKEAQKHLLRDLADTVDQKDIQTLLARARQAPLSEYMRLTQQVIAALLWYKRFAQSVLGVDTGAINTEDGSI